jgi:rare lipoprotein A (peptidoglycan hydrolase)
MKVGAAQTAGAATAAGNEADTLRAARSGNTASLATSQDENARNRARVMADTNLKTTGMNAGVKQEQQQNALHQLSSLYGTNTTGQNAATGESINAEKMMQTQPGWLSTLNEEMGVAEQGAMTGAKIASM